MPVHYTNKLRSCSSHNVDTWCGMYANFAEIQAVLSEFDDVRERQCLPNKQ